jgi:hypothetical protein
LAALAAIQPVEQGLRRLFSAAVNSFQEGLVLNHPRVNDNDGVAGCALGLVKALEQFAKHNLFGFDYLKALSPPPFGLPTANFERVNHTFVTIRQTQQFLYRWTDNARNYFLRWLQVLRIATADLIDSIVQKLPLKLRCMVYSYLAPDTSQPIQARAASYGVTFDAPLLVLAELTIPYGPVQIRFPFIKQT